PGARRGPGALQGREGLAFLQQGEMRLPGVARVQGFRAPRSRQLVLVLRALRPALRGLSRSLAVGVAVNEHSSMNVVLSDPSLYTPAYDAALTRALLAIGVQSTWATRPVRP